LLLQQHHYRGDNGDCCQGGPGEQSRDCFLKRAGLKLCLLETKKVGSKKVRFYRLDQDEFQFMNELAQNLKRQDDEEDEGDSFRMKGPQRYEPYN
jgi:hypothetical protein